jgi:hypothetical protein
MKLRPPHWTLSIDKIALVTYDSIPANAIENCDRLIAAYESGQFPGAMRKTGRRHRIQLVVPVQQNGLLSRPLLIQAEPAFVGLCDFRVEFNPALMGPAGVEQVIRILDSIFIGGGQHLLQNSIVTRIDTALDFLRLSAEKVVVRSKGKRTHGVFSNKHGHPETINLGKSKSNQTSAYNKTNDEGSFLRLERRLNPRSAANQLALLPDPFRVVQMVHTDSLLPFLEGMIPDQFFDSVRVRGLTHVLATLPPAQRRAIKAVLKDPAQSRLPSTEDVWRSWPLLLRSSGFGFLVDKHEHPPVVPLQRNAE